MNLQKKIEEIKKTKSDINEHIPTLQKYSKGCEHIVEMGVRWVVSTWAFLSENPKKLTSYDLFEPSYYGGDLSDVYETAKQNGIDFCFVEANVLDVDIEECDLLFIDTWHCYNQLIRELRKHSEKVKKHIILHDTETFGIKDEPNHRGQVFEDDIATKTGLKAAINDFLQENKSWEIAEIFKNNNGLTILRRK